MDLSPSTSFCKARRRQPRRVDHFAELGCSFSGERFVVVGLRSSGSEPTPPNPPHMLQCHTVTALEKPAHTPTPQKKDNALVQVISPQVALMPSVPVIPTNSL